MITISYINRLIIVYNMSIYIIQEQRFVQEEIDIFKISVELNDSDDSIICLLMKVDKPEECEQLIIDIFKNKYEQMPDYGDEYFEGNIKEMKRVVCNVILDMNMSEIPDKLKLSKKPSEMTDDEEDKILTSDELQKYHCLADVLLVQVMEFTTHNSFKRTRPCRQIYNMFEVQEESLSEIFNTLKPIHHYKLMDVHNRKQMIQWINVVIHKLFGIKMRVMYSSGARKSSETVQLQLYKSNPHIIVPA